MNIQNEYSLIYSLEELDIAVKFLYDFLPLCSIFAFSGLLGAGKTTLIKKLLKYCGIAKRITSPTFSYVITYENEQKQAFYHFDLYRIAQQAEFYGAGFHELLYQPNSWSFIEWPEVIAPLLTKQTCFVTLEYCNEYERKLTCTFSHDIIEHY